jgi:DNA-binding transcriptional ArsR family regulator
MTEKQSISGFLKNVLGFRDTKAETFKSGQSTTPDSAPSLAPTNPASGLVADSGAHSRGKQPSVPAESGNSAPLTEAYQNRKKGRKPQRDSIGDLQKIVAFIQGKGEATPGDLARKLDMSRSTLTYNLKRLSTYVPGAELTGRSHWTNRPLKYVLGQRRIERMGAGPSLRYRIVEVPQTGSPAQPNSSMDSIPSGCSLQTGIETDQGQEDIQ